MTMNVFEMSDEELLKMDLSQLDEGSQGAAPTEEESKETEESSEDQSQGGNEESQSEGEPSEAEGEAEAQEEKEEEAESQEAQGNPMQGMSGDDAKAPEKKAPESKPEPKSEVKADGSKDGFDYEGEYKKLLAPFNANGREMAVQNVEEAITLMQMGANYNKKMAALKPNLKLIKLLETNNLLSEEKISYLIDLVNKNPQAVNKLVKDSGIDPMDLSAEKADEYRPNVRQVSDKEVELDLVLEELSDSKHYQKTLQVVGSGWDAASRQIVADAPQLLKVINSHMDNGIFDMITAEVERERTFGRLKGVSDIEAYRQVGDAIQAKGGFNHLIASASNQGNSNTSQRVVAPPKPKVDEKLNEKRRAAAPAKPAVASNKPSSDFNPLSLSDEEFAKLMPKFM